MTLSDARTILQSLSKDSRTLHMAVWRRTRMPRILWNAWGGTVHSDHKMATVMLACEAAERHLPVPVYDPRRFTTLVEYGYSETKGSFRRM